MNILALKLHFHIDFYLYTVGDGGVTKFYNSLYLRGIIRHIVTKFKRPKTFIRNLLMVMITSKFHFIFKIISAIQLRFVLK